MRAWVMFLPAFVLVKIARKHCERFPLGSRIVVNPFPGIYIDAGPTTLATVKPPRDLRTRLREDV